MNHIYRNIWNATTGTWTAVAENATAHGKSAGGSVKRATLHATMPAIAAAIVAASLPQPAGAQPVSSVVVSPGAPGNTNTYVAPNGVSVVNIATPNAAGLSHNRYTTYNVNPSGLVLNNGNNDTVARQSQLAGQVTANMNLTTQAATILNEVVVNNRSTLAGFTEVLGGRADVILANPYGITCSGCGFINTDRVTLTTGSPFLATNGGLGGFAVGQGDILITGTGLNATAQQVLDLVTRALRVEAPINGNDVSVATGLNRWNYTTRAVDGNAAATGAAPTYAIDTSALGGMYANRIRLLATEAGVGVRMAGDAAASAGDFTLSAAGRIELQNRVSATGDVTVATTAADAGALALTDASLSSTGRTAIAATGGASLSGSALVAGTDLSIAAASLLDAATTSTAPNANQRSAAGAIDLAVGAGASLGATRWLAGGDLRGRFGSLATTGATQLFSRGGTLIASADKGDLALGLAVLQSAGDLRLSASGRIGIDVGGTLQSRGGDLALASGNGVANAGTVTADAGSVTLRANGTVANSGTLHAARDIDIADLGSGATQAVANTGRLIADRALALKAAGVVNAAGALIQAQVGTTVAAGSVDSQGAWLLSQQGGGTDRVTTGGALRNGGTMQGAGAVAIDASSVDNAGVLQGATGLALAAAGLVNSGSLAATGGAANLRVDGAIDNSGLIYAQGALDIADRKAGGSAGFSNTGLVITDAALAIRASAFSNTQLGGNTASGRIQSGTSAAIAVASIRNGGTLLAGTTLAVDTTDAVSNTGFVQADAGSRLTAGSLDNAGTWLLSTRPGAAGNVTVGGTLANSGTLQSEGAMALAAGSVANTGAIVAATALAASTAGGFDNTRGVVQAGSALDLDAGGHFGNTAGALVKARSVAITATGLDNAGIVTADAGAQTLRVDGTLANSGTLYARQSLDIADRSGGAGQSVANTGIMLTDAALALKGASVSNSQVGVDTSTGRIQAASASDIVAASLENSGSWLLSTQPGASNAVAVGGRLGNSGKLQGSGDTTVTASSVDNSGLLYAAGNLNAAARGDFANGGTVQSGRTATLSSGGILANTGGGLVKAVDLDLRADALDNAGNLVASGGAATLRIASRFDNGGGLYAGTALDIADRNGAGSAALTNTGVMLAGSTLTLKAASFANTQRGGDTTTGRIQAAEGSQVSAASLVNTGIWLLSTQGGGANDTVDVAGRLTNSGTLQSRRSADLRARDIDNSGVLYAASALGVTTTDAFRNLAGGIAQAGEQLRLTAAASVANAASALLKGSSVALTSTGFDNDGTLSADTGAAVLRVDGTLDNSGTLYAKQRLDAADRQAAGGATLVNTGQMLADGDMALQARTLNNTRVGTATATGRIQATTGSVVTASSLNNSGAWLLSRDAAARDTVEVGGTLTNSGTLQSAGGVIVAATTIANSGFLLASGSLDATATTLANTASGTAQAGRSLSVNVTTLTNQGRLIGDRLTLAAMTLNNGGIVQGGASSASDVAVGGTLTNGATGVITLATTTGGNGTVAATRIVNDGALQSVGALELGVGTGGLANAGTAYAGGDLTVKSRATGGAYTADVGGTLESGGLLDVAGNVGTTLNVGGAGSVLGERVAMALGTVNLANGGTLSSKGDLTLSATQLTLAGANAAVLGSSRGTGTTRVTTTSALANNGLLFSGNDLVVGAPSITNGTDGGIAALGNATVRASSGDFLNRGALYARGTLAASAAAGTLTNAATASRYQGTIDADGAVVLQASTLINNSTIHSLGTIDIDAATLRNQYLGGDNRAWGTETARSTSETGHQSQGYNGCGCVDQSERWYYRSTWSKSQYYSGSVPDSSVKPQIIGGTTVRIGFQVAQNLGGLISGRDVILTGKSASATLNNDDLSLATTDYTRTWTEHTEYVAAGGLTYYDRRVENDSTTEVASATRPVSVGVFATNLSGSGFALTNNGATAQPVSAARAGGAIAATVDTPGGRTASGSSLAAPVAGADTTAATGFAGAFGAIGQAATGAVATAEASTAGTVGFAGAGGTTGRTAMSAATVQALARLLSTTATGVRTLDGSNAVSFVAANAANGVKGATFGGTTVALPTNINGYYVTATSPQAGYLVETNPRYQVGSTSVGSDYLSNLLGFSPDVLVRRLGDAGYEAYLIRQQLVAQTGNAILMGSQNASTQVQRLMDQAAAESKDLGLAYGQALTPAQQAGLKQDIVWMVQTEVGGQVVLAPVVYLSQATRAGITGGAVISAENANLSLTSLTNSGGTIVGSKTLNIVSVGDVTNTSGTITGGDVAVSSTQGSIVNRTAVSGSGGDQRYVTDIGKTAGITSTGNLSLDAAKDITNLGATMSAGGDASLKAGGAITFDTIENRTTDTTRGAYRQDGGTGSTTTTTTRVEQVKSGLTTGGNLAMTAGRDITLAGTDTRVGGNADLKAGGDLNILARENTTTSKTTSEASGIGMGGALFGSSKTTTDSLSVRNVGSTFEVGGNASLAAKNDLTIQGSTVDVAGNGAISATNVNVLAGRNYDETNTSTVNASVGKIVNGGTQNTGGSSSGAQASAGKGAASASAGAEASTGSTSSGGVQLSSVDVTTSKTTDLKNVGSRLNFGGDLTVDAKQDVNLVGSKVNAGGNATVNAQNINVIAAKDVATSSSTTTSTAVGLMGSSQSNAGASADASANANSATGASGKGVGLPSADAQANAQASAGVENRLDYMQSSTTTKDTLDIRHQGSGITTGGNMTLNAANSLNVQGSQVGAGGNVDVKATNMTFGAVNDVSETRTSSSTTSVGQYQSGKAGVTANASAETGLKPKAEASVNASAGLEMGFYGSNTQTNTVNGSTTAVTSGITAGGNINRTATGGITDVGTQIGAGGNLNQSATTITSKAAANTTYGSSSTETNTGKLGGFAEASAGANASVSADGKAKMENSAGVGAGVRATYENQQDSSRSSSSNAVVSNVKVGGSVSSTSSGKTSLEGTNIAAGRDVTLGASSVDYSAAKNTASSSGDKTQAGASVGVDIANKSVSVGANYDNGKQSASSSTAVVGGIKSGGNVTVNTAGDARFEGTKVEAGGAAAINAGGNVAFDAAKNTTTSKDTAIGASADVTVGKKGSSGGGSKSSKGFEVEGSYQQSTASSSDAVAGSITSGGPLSVNAGGNATFTGTALSSGGDASVKASGNVAFNAARSTSSTQDLGVAASLGGSTSSTTKGSGTGAAGSSGAAGGAGAGSTTKSKEGAVGLSGNYGQSNSDTAQGASIQSGGNVSISSGGNTTLEGTQVKAGGAVAVGAGGALVMKDAVSTSSSLDVGGSLAGTASKESTTPARPAASTTAATAATGATSAAAGSGAVVEPPATTKEISGTAKFLMDSDRTTQGTTLQGGSGVTITSGQTTR